MRLNKNLLPKEIDCPNCKEELELEEIEQKDKKFTCPSCNILFDYTKVPISGDNSGIYTSRTNDESQEIWYMGLTDDEYAELSKEKWDCNYYEQACAKYSSRDFNESKHLFQKEIDLNNRAFETKVSRTQLKYLKRNPPNLVPTWIIIPFVLIFFVLRNDANLLKNVVDFGPYLLMGFLTLYGIIHSLFWPVVFEAKQRYANALSWLWIIAVVSSVVGFLEVINKYEFLQLDDFEAKIAFFIGLAFIISATLATVLKPIFGLVVFIVISIFYAFDTAFILHLVTISYVDDYIKIKAYVYIWLIIHFIALYSFIRGIGGAKGLLELNKPVVDGTYEQQTDVQTITKAANEITQVQQTVIQTTAKVRSYKWRTFVKFYTIIIGLVSVITGFVIAINENFQNWQPITIFSGGGLIFIIIALRITTKNTKE